MRTHLPLLTAMAFFAAGCGFDFERSNQVLDRRILAIQAEPPEIVLDQGPMPTSVQLRALVVDPKEPEGVAEYEWRGCLALPQSIADQAPGLAGTDAAGRCDEEDPATFFGAGNVPMGEVPGSVPLPPGLLEALRAATGGGLGFSINVQAQLRVEAEEGPLYGIKRVVVSPALPEGRQANRNPRLTALLFEGEPWQPDEPMRVVPGLCAPKNQRQIVDPADPTRFVTRCTYTVTPVFDEGEAEPYRVQTFDGEVLELRERLRFRWFTDKGVLSDGATAQPTEIGPRRLDPLSTRWSEPAEATGTSTFWVVVRDGRGGTSWERREIVFVED